MALLRQNLIYSGRRFMRMPGVVLAVILSIGIGIAANATIFSMVSTFLLKPAPVGDPGTLIGIHSYERGDRCCNNLTWPLYRDVQERTKSFSGVAAIAELLPASIGGNGEPQRVWGQAATSNFFDVTQLRMPLGRGFRADEENQHVIVLGYNLWKRRFAGDTALIGKVVTVSGQPYTIVGVAPLGFHGVDLLLNPEFWVPLGNMEQLAANISNRTSRNYHWLSVIGRLAPGATQSSAAAELNSLAVDLAKAYPATDKNNNFRIDAAGSLPQSFRSSVVLFLGVLAIVALLVLCIACANVANLMLTQAAARQREMAVRLTLGATRGQLMRQMLTESVVLGLAGGLLGVFLALWATSALSSFHLPAPVPMEIGVSVDWRVLSYACALSLGAGLFFGVAPAWVASNPAIASALKGEDALARPGRRFNLRNMLVVLQIAVSLVLLCVTGLFLRSLNRAAGIDVGFRSQGLLMVSVDPRVHGYSADRTIQFLNELRERAAALPGVTSAVTTDVAPLSMGNRSDGFHEQGVKPTGAEPSVDLYMVSPGYFQTMGIPQLLGTDVSNESATAPKVAVVNQTFVRRVLQGADPVGRSVEGGGVTYRIIGVVGDTKSRTIGEEQRPVLYRPLTQSIGSDPSFLGYSLIVRTSGDEAAVASGVRNIISSLDPAMAVYNAETMQQHLRDALVLPRLAGTLFTIFGSAGLILAAVGLYGVVSYSVRRRRQEIGIRIALGSPLVAVQRLILGQGLRLIAVALVIGFPTAWMAARFARSFLYGVQPHDRATFIAMPLFLAAIALVAAWIPARRAATVDPMTVLHYE
ncbi:ABC transporter permease [Edaphobacter albus]|uniref:ABC transporter permease n=1 Tax=Edaphobacter sp. 4G125 TaxID=2763071 RepID=UPI00164853FD|nr:ABC transporter permease [Edaphobacter sp. 4G125]QNI37117.1 ABC transporter permease [Edaphobacter sp. 4G125]